ncbi:IclR family transcriptional regulator [Pengzhenrongella sicca]|uniref:IclR family transcriptional regulator n=1 Tax=Pengzhenrongella sicca TaxID=2819238 RepID=A0A8A4ZCN5_9MICO|nr:IclR family transcriptional regulator [Pengzhenrongella sicca]QTE28257.1 IclR family transcriptional regulator [Pengzhenrongella sicca]
MHPTRGDGGSEERPEDQSADPTDDRLVGSDRVLAVLTALAGYPEGIGLDELARSVHSPKPTVHRALASLRRAGLARQDGRGHYVLGDEFLRLAFAHHEARPEHVRVHPILERLSQRFGETVHYAVLEGGSVVYRAKVDPPAGAIKLTSVVGGRNPAHTTAVGKLLLSDRLPDLAAVRAWVGDRDLERRTEHTLTTPEALHAELARTRARGYGVDDEENEPGVSCLALPLFLTSPTAASGAISVSALSYRTPLPALIADLPTIRSIITGA